MEELLHVLDGDGQVEVAHAVDDLLRNYEELGMGMGRLKWRTPLMNS